MSQAIYVTIPEYQPSQASITLGGNIYKPSQKAENVTVGRVGLDVGTIALVAIPIGIILIWLWRKK